jgi:hypothetical protein
VNEYVFQPADRVTEEGHFCAVHITPARDNSHNNSDGFMVTINTGQNGGQQMMIGSRDVDFVSFKVIGTMEIQEIVQALSYAYDRMIEGDLGVRSLYADYISGTTEEE